MLDKISADYVLKLAVGGIFENINSPAVSQVGLCEEINSSTILVSWSICKVTLMT